MPEILLRLFHCVFNPLIDLLKRDDPHFTTLKSFVELHFVQPPWYLWILQLKLLCADTHQLVLLLLFLISISTVARLPSTKLVFHIANGMLRIRGLPSSTLILVMFLVFADIIWNVLIPKGQMEEALVLEITRGEDYTTTNHGVLTCWWTSSSTVDRRSTAQPSDVS